jgi:HK97 family phage major capsid protein
MINRANEKQEDKEVRNYSFVRALAQVNKSGRLEGLEAEMDQEARKEFASSAITPEGILTVPSRVIMSNERRNAMREARAVMTATGQDGGSTFVQTDVIDFIGALYDKNVLTSMGSRMLTGLVGNIQMPKSGGSSAAWEDEVETNVDVTPVISPITASPKRLGGFGLVSKQLLHQAGNYQVEKLIQDDIISGINQALQVRGITELLATEGIGAVIGGANGAAPTAAHIIELEEKVATAKADVGSLAYLTNPKVRAKLKKTALDAGSGQFVWDLKSYNELMGYVAGITTSVPSNIAKNDGTDLSAIIFGNFSDLLICGWGGFDIVLNPYTNAKTNQLEIIINSYWDMIIRNAGSFAAMQDAKTAD